MKRRLAYAIEHIVNPDDLYQDISVQFISGQSRASVLGYYRGLRILWEGWRPSPDSMDIMGQWIAVSLVGIPFASCQAVDMSGERREEWKGMDTQGRQDFTLSEFRRRTTEARRRELALAGYQSLIELIDRGATTPGKEPVK